MGAGNIANSKLPPGGEAGQYLQKNSANRPAWVDLDADVIPDGSTYGKTTVAGAASANSIGALTTASGDLLYATGNDAFQRLAVGTDGQVLQSMSGAPQWASVANLAVSEYANLAAFPVSGSTTTIYKAIDTGKLYRWFGTAYSEIPASMAAAAAATIVTGTAIDAAVTPGRLKDSLALSGMWLTKRTKMPDVTAAVSKASFADTTGCVAEGTPGSTLSASSGILRVAWSGSTTNRVYYNDAAAVSGKLAICKVRASRSGLILHGYNYTSTANIGTFIIGTDWQIISFYMPIGSARFGLIEQLADCISGDYFEVGWFWVGDLDATTKQLYTVGTLSEEAARIADQLGDSMGAGTKAYSTLTSTGTAPADGDTVTIGGKAYAFKTTLGTTEGQILIGDTASAAAALDNLKLAINGDAGTFGVNHYCAAANPLVTATTNTDTTQVVEATATGLLGNQIATAESSTKLSWANPDGGTGYLSRGTNDVTQKILTSAANYIAGSGTRPAAAKVELTNTGLIGYETTVDVASGGSLTLPSGGTWIWNVYGYGATISSAKRGSSAGGTTLTVAGANASVGYRRYA